MIEQPPGAAPSSTPKPETEQDTIVYPELRAVPWPEGSLRFNASHARDLARAPGIAMDEHHRQQFMYGKKVDEVYFYTAAELAEHFRQLVAMNDYWAARDVLHAIASTTGSSILNSAADMVGSLLDEVEQNPDGERSPLLDKQVKLLTLELAQAQKQLQASEAFLNEVESSTHSLTTDQPDPVQSALEIHGGNIPENIISLKEHQAKLAENVAIAQTTLERVRSSGVSL